VQALSEELASGRVASEREPLYHSHMLRESRRLSGLVEDTLDFARLEAGRLAFRMEPADLRRVVREAIEGSDGAGRVVARLPDDPVVGNVDAAALRRAVRNLVDNAVRHGGGDAPVRVELSATNGHASIAVIDRGRGIAPEHQPRLFERFFRVPSATHETKGVGLGLALCREVARAHGGDVDVESRVGAGSTFTLRLPTAPRDASKGEAGR
jgi:signal transduction histidine kinase